MNFLDEEIQRHMLEMPSVGAADLPAAMMYSHHLPMGAAELSEAIDREKRRWAREAEKRNRMRGDGEGI